MNLFKFLELLDHEKYPFTIEYAGYSGLVLVNVELFNKKLEFLFNENGLIEFEEFKSIRTSEDKYEISTILNSIIDRPEKAWKKASEELKFEIITPYKFIGIDGEEYEAPGLIPNFGYGKGVILLNRKTDEETCIMAELSNDYFITALSPIYYDEYDKDTFVSTLKEWKWIGPEEDKPSWII